MSESQSDPKRRRFLVGATSAVGVMGVAGAATPFVLSMMPSEAARAAGAPVEVDIASLEPGMMITQGWRGQPIWVIKRTPEMMEQLTKNAPQLSDPESHDSNQPEYCKNVARSSSEHPEILVVVGICTHLGCSPVSRSKVGNAEGMGDNWPGGFFCPCHGSRYDMSARVFKAQPAPLNMRVPPYTYLSNTRLLIGEDKKAG